MLLVVEIGEDAQDMSVVQADVSLDLALELPHDALVKQRSLLDLLKAYHAARAPLAGLKDAAKLAGAQRLRIDVEIIN